MDQRKEGGSTMLWGMIDEDLYKVGQVDTSVDTTIETMDTTETEQKVDLMKVLETYWNGLKRKMLGWSQM